MENDEEDVLMVTASFEVLGPFDSNKKWFITKPTKGVDTDSISDERTRHWERIKDLFSCVSHQDE